jgi:hypothetical protein
MRGSGSHSPSFSSGRASRRVRDVVMTRCSRLKSRGLLLRAMRMRLKGRAKKSERRRGCEGVGRRDEARSWRSVS